MRDIVLALGLTFYIPMALRVPAAGLLCWEWFSIMSPHRQVFGFLLGQPLASLVAVATLVGWLISADRKRWTGDLLPWVMLALVLWMTVNGLASPQPEQNWLYWDRVMRTFAPVFLVFVLMTKQARMIGMVWVLVISLGYYGVKGGGFTIVNGGSGIVFGPPDSVLGDNNQLALGIVTELPLLYFLWRHTAHRLLRMGMLAALGLQVVMVFGSYSRGGVIALAVVLGLIWLRSDHKLIYGGLGAAMVVAGLSVMPQSFWDRMHTLNNVEGDASFHGRLVAWQVAFRYAKEHFPFGAGFYVPQMAQIFNSYFPDEVTHAAHSIYFQMLGEHGFTGLALFLLMIGLALRNTGIVVRRTRGDPELAWLHDLADMVRVSLLSFCVGGAALSMAYFDGYLILIALSSTMREMAAPRRVTVPQAAAAPARAGLAPPPAPQAGRLR